MKIAIFEDVGKIKIEEFPEPQLEGEDILVKIHASAICTWEQRVYTGIKKVKFPFVGGHEISGEIIDLGPKVDKTNWSIGDKVVYGTNLACGQCKLCKMSEEQNCINFNHEKDIEYLPNLRGMGGFATHIVAQPKHLFKFDKVSYEEACLAEPISCVHQSVSRSEAKMGEIALVMGCGIMGQLHIKLAKMLGLKIIAADFNDERLQHAKKNGASHVINPQTKNLNEEVMKITDGLGVDIIYNTVAKSEVAESLMPILAIHGRHVLYSSFYPPTDMKINPDAVHKKAQKIIGTANSNSKDFMIACSLLTKNQIEVSDLIEEVFPFEKIDAAIEKASSTENYRIVLKNN